MVTARHVFGDSVAFPRSLFLVPLCFAVALGFYVLIDRTIERWRVRLIDAALAEKATP